MLVKYIKCSSSGFENVINITFINLALPIFTTKADFSGVLLRRVPHTFGMQDISTSSGNLFWINESYTLLPRELKKLNYTTHMLGKWHLGFCHPGLTPIGQGFDTFYGMWYGSHTSYYNHTKNVIYDWWDDWNIDLSAWVRKFISYTSMSLSHCSAVGYFK